MTAELVLFYAFAFLALVSAIAMVAFVKHVIAGAMSLVVTMISLAGIYVLLQAELVAAIQILVYAGAILVLFLFIIMLFDVRVDGFGPASPLGTLAKVFGVLGVVVLALLLAVKLPAALPGVPGELPAGFGGYRSIGLVLYGEYVVVVEAVALVLLAAMVGAVVLAKRSLDG